MLAVLALAACGGDDGGEGGTSGQGGAGGTSGTSGEGGTAGGASNDVAADGICERVAAIQCAAQEDCCDSPDKDVAGCTEDLIDDCSDLEAVAADPIVGYDRAAMKAALDELEMRASTCDTTLAAWALTADGFASSFTGTRAAGADCLPEGGAETTDIDAFTAALASCSNPATTACLPGDDAWTCTARGAADSPCFTDLNCQDGLYCDLTAATGPFDGKCTARKAAEATCSIANECESFVCTSGACAADDDVQAAYCF
jgi:hypothetical protein